MTQKCKKSKPFGYPEGLLKKSNIQPKLFFIANKTNVIVSYFNWEYDNKTGAYCVLIDDN